MAVVAPLAVGAAPSWASPGIGISDGEPQTYIVQLADRPIAVYDGEIRGLAATRPAAGEKVDVTSSAAQAYSDHLASERARTLSDLGVSQDDVVAEYDVAFNGFAVSLTPAQAALLLRADGVANVWEDELHEADTIDTPRYLGMDGEDGVWNQVFEGHENAGAGIVVGVIDSGIWPENPSFAPLPGDPAPPAGWTGECEAPADGSEPVECTSKLIGARYYGAEYGNTVNPWEFVSARDYNGHGTHTAGTAAGNFGVEAVIGGNEIGTLSGMAPAAQIAAYKGLWATPAGSASGTTAGLVAAINDAVADGVDVINYSISGSRTSIVGAVDIAFLAAADAGIFIATSAGNAGDTVGESSVAHNSPWTTTVAASTHDRNVGKTVRVGDDLPGVVERWGGIDRYETAAIIASAFGEVDTVYLATGTGYADALTGSAPAAQGFAPQDNHEGLAAPVLLTRQDLLPRATRAALAELSPTTIVLLGDHDSISTEIEQELAQVYDVERVSGANRYETAAELARLFPPGLDKVYVATGTDPRPGVDAFADALSVSALAGHEGVPVLLTRPDLVPGVVADVLDELDPDEIIVLGSNATINDETFAALGGTSRIEGPDRWATSAAVAAHFEPGDITFVASGFNFPDALAGSSLAGSLGVPVLLTQTNNLVSAARAELVRLDPDVGVLLGGTPTLTQRVEDQLNALFQADSDFEEFDGVGVGEAVGPAPLVNSVDIPAAGATPEEAELCYPGSLDPEGAAGNIVICTRGVIARVDKSLAVAQAGGIGMIQTNVSDTESLNADFHAVPSIHVDATSGAAIKAYEAGSAAPTAYISAQATEPVEAPEMAGFSSYGPALAGDGDLLKPDITAPGVDVIAAVAPPGNQDEDFFGYSGTSMSAPHIAGLAALMMQENPDWSPIAVKSALMSTASPLTNEGGPIQRWGADATALDYGAGEVRPAAAYSPGLVYESDVDDWIDYICAIGQVSGPLCEGVVLDPSDLNYPSIAIGALSGSQTVTRTVTSYADTEVTFTAEVEAPAGVTTTVEPASITLAPGASASYEVTFEVNDDAVAEEYTFGSLTWTGGGYSVRSPIAVQPSLLAAPDEVSGTGSDGATTVTVTPGYTGELVSTVSGLGAGTIEEVDIFVYDEFLDDGWLPIEVPAGTAHLRLEIFDADYDGIDLDLYLVSPGNQIIASSAVAGSDEMVEVSAPEPGLYHLAIDWWDGTAGDEMVADVHQFVIPESDAGNLTVTPNPAPVVLGVPAELTFTWTGLDADSRYLGVVGYSSSGNPLGSTLVSIN